MYYKKRQKNRIDKKVASESAPSQVEGTSGGLPEAPFVPQSSQRARWKHGTRIFGIIIMVILNVSLVMSDLERSSKHLQFHLQKELITYAALLLLDAAMLLPIILEVDQIDLTADKLILKTVFWTFKLDWVDVLSYKTAPMWKYGLLRTRRCFFLLNKRDLKNFADLAPILCQRISTTTPAPRK